MLTVKTCCCGISLRTGSLIILWMNLMSCINWFFIFVSFNFEPAAGSLKPYLILITSANIAKKRDWLIPFIVFEVLKQIGLLAIVMYMIIFSTTISSHIEKQLQDLKAFDENQLERLHSIFQWTIALSVFVLIIVLVIDAHFTLVVYSFYEQMGRPISTAKSTSLVPPQCSIRSEYGRLQMENAPPHDLYTGIRYPMKQ